MELHQGHRDECSRDEPTEEYEPLFARRETRDCFIPVLVDEGFLLLVPVRVHEGRDRRGLVFALLVWRAEINGACAYRQELLFGDGDFHG